MNLTDLLLEKVRTSVLNSVIRKDSKLCYAYYS